MGDRFCLSWIWNLNRGIQIWGFHSLATVIRKTYVLCRILLFLTSALLCFSFEFDGSIMLQVWFKSSFYWHLIFRVTFFSFLNVYLWVLTFSYVQTFIEVLGDILIAKLRHFNNFWVIWKWHPFLVKAHYSMCQFAD